MTAGRMVEATAAVATVVSTAVGGSRAAALARAVAVEMVEKAVVPRRVGLLSD